MPHRRPSPFLSSSPAEMARLPPPARLPSLDRPPAPPDAPATTAPRPPGTLLLVLGLLLGLVGLSGLPQPAQGQTATDLRPRRGAPGSPVFLRGTDLDVLGGGDVQFGGVGAPLLSNLVSTTVEPTLTAVEVPTGVAGPVPVSVLGRTAAQRFTVITGGPGTFPAETTVFSDEDNASSPRTVDYGDIDGDGDLDLVVGFSESGVVRWYANDGTGTFGEGQTITSGLQYPRDIELADVVDDTDPSSPRDGALDIIVAGGEGDDTRDGDTNDTIVLFPNQRTGTDAEDVSFGSQTLVQSSPVDDPRDLAAGDIDLDGDVDLLSVSQDNGALVRHRNDDGTSTFTEQTLGTYDDPRAVALANLQDTNEVPDLVVAEYSGGRVLLFNGNGDGTFSQINSLAATTPVALDIADFDGNGLPGLIVGTDDAGTAVQAFVQATAGSFVPASLSGTTGRTPSVHAADLVGGDGVPEVLVGNESSGEVTLHGYAGGFSLNQTLLSSGGSPSDLQAVDTDGDGDLDPVVLTRNADRVAVYPNGPSAPTLSSFPADTTINEDTQTAARPFSVTDLDTDVSDLTVTASSSNPALVPDANVVLEGSGADRTVTATPRPDSSGTTTITVSVSDESSTASASYTLTVAPVNDAPTIQPLSDQTISEDQVSSALFGASDVETDLTSFNFSAASSNPDLLPAANVSFVGPDSDGLFRVDAAPRTDSTGTATITVTVDDLDGETTSTSYVVTVEPVNDPPSLDVNAGLSLPDQDTAEIGNSQLSASDVDDPADNVIYTVTALPSQGDLLVNGTPLTSGGTFTQQALADGRVAYAHTGTGGDSFSFDLADDDAAAGASGATFSIAISATNQAPVLETSAGLSTDEDTDATLTSSALLASDVDDPAENILYTVTTPPAKGTLLVGGTALSGGGTFSQQAVSDGLVTYAPAPDSNGVDSFGFDLADDGGALSVSDSTFSISVAPVNDAPTLQANTGLSVDEDASATLTTADLSARDVDDAASDLRFVIESGPVHGRLLQNGELLSDNSFTQEALADGRLSYVPDADYSGPDSLVFRLEDAVGAVGPSGESFSISVTPVNDAPTLTATSGLAIDEDETQPLTTAVLSATDVDDAPGDILYRVTSVPSNGVLSVGGTALADSESFSQQALRDSAVVYVPDANYNGTDSFTFDLVDDGGATGASGETVSITVSPLNDVPTLPTNASLPVGQGQTATIDSSRLAATDVEDGPSALQFTVDAPPTSGTLRRSGEPLAGGFTQADLNAGRLTYSHDGSAGDRDRFAFTVTDEGGAGRSISDTLDIAVTVVTLAAATDTLRAGPVQTGTPDSLALTLSNGGNVPLTGLQGEVSDLASPPPGVTSAPADFGGVALPDTLAVGDTLRATVAFTPSAAGRRGAALQVSSAEGGQARAVLLGRGLDVSVTTGPVERGQPVGVDVTIAGGYAPGPSPDTLFVRPGGTTAYRAVPLSTTAAGPPPTLSAEIADSLVTPRGLDYYVTLSGAGRLLTVPAGGRAAARARPRHLPVSFEQLAAPIAFAPERYRMVSVPAAPAAGLKAALQNAYGPYDAAAWRLERWDAAADGGAGAYRGYPQVDSLRPGDGFWLVSAEGAGFALDDGATIPADRTYTVPLQAGWNQVGTPFGFAVPWDTVRAASDLPAAQVDGPFAYRDSSFQIASALAPWTGYFLYSSAPDTLRIPPAGTASGKRLDGPPAPALRAGSAASGAASPYTLEVSALAASGRATTVLGLRPGARDGRDRFDRARPPSMRPGLRLSALTAVDGRAVPHAASAKPLSATSGPEAGQTWTLRLSSPTATDVRLRLQATGSLPDGYRPYVLDHAQNRRIVPGATLSLDKDESRRLTVIVGTEAYADQASGSIALESLTTTLRGSYPNPFSEEATIAYVLSSRRPVRIDIYNILGQKVETLVDASQPAGRHQIAWDGTNRYGQKVGSGVYFYRLEAGGVTQTRKMVLVR